MRTPRLLFLGSSCIYPKFAEQPIREDSLLTGPLEETNKAYAIAKIAGIAQVQAVRKQHALRWTSAMPTNLYGPNDNFDLESSHVIAAMIRKFVEAVDRGDETVTLWGTGNPSREFLYVDDAARGLLLAAERLAVSEPVNLGVGRETRIRDLAELIRGLTGFQGAIEWDTSRPDGQPKRYLDVARARELIGFEARVGLEDGLRRTIASFREQTARVA